MRADVRKYGMKRVEDLLSDRLNALREKHTKKGKAATPLELFKALKAGKLPFRSDVCSSGINKYTGLKEVYDLHALDVDDKFDEAAYEKAAKPIIKAANKAKDFIMLGKDEPALDAIREFEAENE
jgi:hypothetical protein